MNKNAIKNYAIWARNELITRVTQKAFEYGVSKENIVDFNAESVNGKLLTSEEKQQRQKLISEVKEKGFDQVMEEVAYTWFNRFIALRYMEVNNYLPNRIRVFTNENNEFKPQLLDEAATIELDGLGKENVYELLDSNKNEELYKLLLLATCNDMHKHLPGMFETINDYKVLLFPENLLRNESVIGRMILDIDEDSWQDQVQIIGWMYQFYNTELKDKVMGRKSGIKIEKEEVPAVTQLFTPDWIVRYMVENSLGRLWLDGHEDNEFKSNWKYYLDEVKQEPEVVEKLKRIREEHSQLKLEDIKFIDPCMGSGHILVYAFDVFMQLYQSEGYTPRDAAKLILENNLYGLDIDERAYQLASFALMMKARQYNRRILTSGIEPNLCYIQSSNDLSEYALEKMDDYKSITQQLITEFKYASEYGSVLNVSLSEEDLQNIQNQIDYLETHKYDGDLIHQSNCNEAIATVKPILKQAIMLVQKYDVVVTNPPYMPVSNAGAKLSDYVKENYPDSKTDLFAVFIERCKEMLKVNGYQAMITMHSWLFISSYEKLRKKILLSDIISMAHLGARAFDEIAGEVVQTTSFVMRKSHLEDYKGTYCRLIEPTSEKGKADEFLAENNRYYAKQKDFGKIPGMPISYWVSKQIIKAFDKYPSLGEMALARNGMKTGDNNQFVRLWWEVADSKFNSTANSANEAVQSGAKWFPYNKGGEYRKWYGNNDCVVNWENEGACVIGKAKIEKRNVQDYPNKLKFLPSATWSLITSKPAFRYKKCNISDIAGMSFYPYDDNLHYYLGFCNTIIASEILKLIAPTINFQAGDISRLPIIIEKDKKEIIENLVKMCIDISSNEWDSFEVSWDFKKHPLICYEADKVSVAFEKWSKECENHFNQLKANEEKLNSIFMDIYGLQDELTPEVEDKDVTVRKADLQRDIKSLLSYAVGCMFGRYSLNLDGLAYAGGEWDNRKYSSFIPDVDNIIPICDDEYFEDDIVGRFIEFVKAVYGEDSLDENLLFIADALGGKGTPREVLRNYFLNDFFKDHCNTYQVSGSGKRPIYWLFDSGKKNGFKALMYIHRYTPDLIARMRTQYVHELQAKYRNQIELLEGQIDANISSSERVKLNKQLKKYKEQDEELRKYEEVVHHWADKMEPMDLDDGVKANYAKFQPLLAKIK